MESANVARMNDMNELRGLLRIQEEAIQHLRAQVARQHEEVSFRAWECACVCLCVCVCVCVC
jgi:hypothetical protein